MTLGELKNQLSKKFSIPVSILIVRKGKDKILYGDSEILKNLNFGKQTKLLLSISKSASFTIINCQLLGLNPEFSTSLSFIQQGTLELVLESSEPTVLQAKEEILLELEKQGIFIQSVKRIRLREIMNGIKYSVLNDRERLKRIGKIELMAEVLDFEEDRKDHERLVYLKSIDESFLSFPFELWLHRDSTLHLFGGKVEELLGCKIEEIECLRKNLEGGTSSKWIEPFDDRRLISEDPWNIKKDGELIL